MRKIDSRSFITMAKHFTEDMGVNVVFKNHTKPRVKNKTIYLPKDFRISSLNSMLTALLHEAYHIRYTKGNYGYLSSDIFSCLNLLEDMRIENKIFAKYPRVNGLFKLIVQSIVDNVKEECISPEHSRLLHFMLDYQKYNDFFFDEEAIKFWKKYKREMKQIESKIDNAESTGELVLTAEKLAKLISTQLPEQKEKSQENSSGELNKSQNSRKNKSSKDSSDKDDNNDDDKDRENEERSDDQETDQEGQEDDEDEDEENEDNDIENENIINSSAEQEQEYLGEEEFIAILEKGIRSLSTDDIEIKEKEPPLLQIKTVDLGEELFNLLKMTQNREISFEEGKIVPQNLPYYYDPDKIFLEDIIILEPKSNISFIIDCSGSMTDYIQTDERDQRKYLIAISSLLSILDTIYKFEKDRGFIKFNVFAFNTKYYYLKAFNRRYNKEEIQDNYLKRVDGDTCPIPALEKALKEFPPDGKKIIFLITDGLMGDGAYKWIEKNIPRDIIMIYIWITDNTSSIPEKFKQSFPHYVTQIEDLENVLREQIKNILIQY